MNHLTGNDIVACDVTVSALSFGVTQSALYLLFTLFCSFLSHKTSKAQPKLHDLNLHEVAEDAWLCSFQYQKLFTKLQLQELISKANGLNCIY